jgi:hypothetical protein
MTSAPVAASVSPDIPPFPTNNFSFYVVNSSRLKTENVQWRLPCVAVRWMVEITIFFSLFSCCQLRLLPLPVWCKKIALNLASLRASMSCCFVCSAESWVTFFFNCLQLVVVAVFGFFFRLGNDYCLIIYFFSVWISSSFPCVCFLLSEVTVCLLGCICFYFCSFWIICFLRTGIIFKLALQL